MISDVEKLNEHLDFLRGVIARMSGGPMCLICEDDENDLYLIQRELDKFVCRTETVKDGEAALKQIKENKYDFIFIDQAVPKLSGSEILQKTAGMREHAKVILVTGHIGSPQIPDAMKAGAVLAFAKPITEATLKTLGLVLKTA